MSRNASIPPTQFTTFGNLLESLRRRAGLTQRELSIAVGYSESQISCLEQNQRVPDTATLAARFVRTVRIGHEPEWVKRLLELAAQSGQGALPAPDVVDAPAPPHNLPIQLTSFIGREIEIGQITHLVSRYGLVALVGPGGTGKTRLSWQVAAGLLNSFPDGTWLVDLAPLADPDLVTQTVATVLEVHEPQGVSRLAMLIDSLRERRVLLLIDNCEHLVDACAHLAAGLLRGCSNLYLLAASRKALGVAGEAMCHVPSLASPDVRQLISPESIVQCEAVQLLVERATAAMPTFRVTSDSVAAVAQVCLQLDGIPLAIELAAAKVNVLRVEQIAARLSDRFRLLTGGSRTTLRRHQTLRATMDWSYDLLGVEERFLLRRMRYAI